MTLKREIEVKIEIDDAEAIASKLAALGATPRHPREFEDNVLLDRDGGALAREGKLLRVRRHGGRGLLTVKGPDPEAFASDPTYKIRREEEVEVDDPAALVRALALAGYRPVWRYQKWRRSFALDGAQVLVDELTLGAFLEIEGEPAAIDAVARRLGFTRQDYVTASYRELHERRRRAQGLIVDDLVFPGARAFDDSPQEFA